MLGALTIHRLLEKMKEVDASDLHIKIGSPPVLRIASALHRIEAPDLNGDDTRQLLTPIIPPHLKQQFEQAGGVDFSHTESADARFRCSIFHAGGGVHAAIRRVNPVIPSFDELHLPSIYREVADTTHEGLVVICGVTGCGKSTTLAAMIDHINETRHCNIITIEDPVEYLFRPNQSFISQREIGIDVADFPLALRSAVRQDPDVIMIGEMRDRETMMAGLQSAETGHTVFVTLHTADTMQSFARILEFFPSSEHKFIRSSLANGLGAIMAQRLLPSVRDDVARVPATEVLLNSPIVQEKIREAQDEDMPAIIHSSEGEGMHDFTSSLARLVDEEWVDLRTAERYAPNREALISKVRGIEVAADKLIQRVKR
ncbi:MAG: PilT/PilU family type 4a pilus ATPase [Planctomycetota bacterium]|nr:PilT/PilU family type 4a pilus ATPase [Planctomycetota bacterium]